MSATNYQTYSNNQAYFPQTMAYAHAQAPLPTIPMGSPSPMFQPMQFSGPVPQVYLSQPALPQLNCGVQAMSLGSTPIQGAEALSLQSQASLGSMPGDFSLPLMTSDFSLPAVTSDQNFPAMTSSGSLPYGGALPFVGSNPSLPQRSLSPVFMPSPSPAQGVLPMVSYVPATQPMPVSFGNVYVTGYFPNCSPEIVPPEPSANSHLLGYRGTSIPRSRSSSPAAMSHTSYSEHLPRQRSRSICSDSVGSIEREFRDCSAPPAEPSKRELVNCAFEKLQKLFGANFDQEGNRGQNILRLKVKTRQALEQIVPLIEFIQTENLIVSVSCPISTKKGRQQVRGFLAYIQFKDARDADRAEQLIAEYNASNGSPFNTCHRDPPSTWKTQA